MAAPLALSKSNGELQQQIPFGNGKLEKQRQKQQQIPAE